MLPSSNPLAVSCLRRSAEQELSKGSLPGERRKSQQTYSLEALSFLCQVMFPLSYLACSLYVHSRSYRRYRKQLTRRKCAHVQSQSENPVSQTGQKVRLNKTEMGKKATQTYCRTTHIFGFQIDKTFADSIDEKRTDGNHDDDHKENRWIDADQQYRVKHDIDHCSQIAHEDVNNRARKTIELVLNDLIGVIYTVCLIEQVGKPVKVALLKVQRQTTFGEKLTPAQLKGITSKLPQR